MITRRFFIGGCCALCASKAFAYTDPAGCIVSKAQADRLESEATEIYSFSGNGPPQAVFTSGHQLLDVAFVHAIAKLTQDFHVFPGFAYYNDPELDAKAYPFPYLKRKDGTIYICISFINFLLKKSPHAGAAILAVAAHEYGHIVQYKHKLVPILNPDGHHPKPMELHADYLSGWYAGRRKLRNSNFPAQEFTNVPGYLPPSLTHGTAEERGNAIQAGFLSAAQDKLPLAQAVDAGIAYVTGNPSTPSKKPFTNAPVVSFQ